MNQSLLRRAALSVGAPIAAVVFSLVVSAIVLLISQNNPIAAFGDMLENASRLETFVDILNGATPLYISGVAAAIGFRMNLFNIGVEGQYLLAAFFAASIGSASFVIDLPPPLHLSVIFLTAMVVGAAWSGIAGVLKVTRGINEVISTIMLNFIAIGGVIAWLILEWKDDSGSSVSTGTKEIDASGRLPNLNGVLEIVTREVSKGRELTSMIFVAILVGIGYHLFINRTRIGFDFRASGYNPLAARAGGVPPKQMIMYAMLLSGAVAGLVGMFEVVSDNYRFSDGFVRSLGFNGIAVALIGRNNPTGIAVGALLFSFLSASSGILQITGSATPAIVEIMKGIIVLSAVVAYEVVNRIKLRDEAKSAAEATARMPNTEESEVRA